MAHPREGTVQGIATRLISVLDQYETDTETLVRTWLDLEVFGRITREVEQIHIFCATLPQVGRQWADLVIAHTELVHALWKGGDMVAPSPVLERCIEDHRLCVRALRRHCVHRFARDLSDPLRTGATDHSA